MCSLSLKCLIVRFAGVPPFLCFDSHSSDIVYSSTPYRSRIFQVIINTSVTMHSLIPSFVFNQYEGLEVLIADDRIDLKGLIPFLPDSAHIHQVCYKDTSSDFMNMIQNPDMTIIRNGGDVGSGCHILKTGDSITLDVSEDDKLQLVVRYVIVLNNDDS